MDKETIDDFNMSMRLLIEGADENYDDALECFLSEVEDELEIDDDDELEHILEDWQTRFDAAWKEHEKRAASWPEDTVNARIDRAFASMRRQGIVAVQCAGATLSEGWTCVFEEADSVENAWGGVFYHTQDLEGAIDGDGLMLAFGVLDESGARNAHDVATRACELLTKQGVSNSWAGDVQARIEIAPFPWRRRRQTTS